MKIMKFGGSSVATPDRIKAVAQIIKTSASSERVIVVLSAFQGVTNQLLECARLAEQGGDAFEQAFAKIAARHRETLDALPGAKDDTEARADIEHMLRELHEALQGIRLLRYSPPRAMDIVASFGERLSARTLTAYLNASAAAVYVDSRQCVVTDDAFMNAAVNFELTNPLIKTFFKDLYRKHGRNTIAVMTGFLGATPDGRTTTIGRNGSDYSAAITGGALSADMIEIWTDVDGVLSADPRAVRSAFVLPQLSYEEAMEMSYFGASVLHSATIAPAVAKGIPVLIKNTLNADAPGTLISKEIDMRFGAAKGITSVDNITLLTLRGMSMVGVPGTAERLFGALASASVNVILISQASSEHTICFAVRTDDAARARQAIAGEFRYELQSKLTSLDERPSQTIVAVVGEGMRGTPGIAGTIFQTLGWNKVNVSAIAQGASERNISFVIDSSQKAFALNVVHDKFFIPGTTVSIALLGPGNVGGEVLEQLRQQGEALLHRGFTLRVVAIANSKKALIDPAGIPLNKWRNRLLSAGEPHTPEKLASLLGGFSFPNAVLIDCSANPEVVDAYPSYIKSGFHIITPNKLANVLPTKRHASLMDLFRKERKQFFYEANVGAGLPVISTLKDLIETGDEVHAIEGLLSGTLSFLFNAFDGTRPFSELVRVAHESGFTEPDPREDLGGKDAARKLLILGRTLGHAMELRDVHVESLVPAALRKGKFSAGFYRELARHDGAMLKRYENAKEKGLVLRYVAALRGRTATARLEELSPDHPFAQVKGSESVLMFTTARYGDQPLVIKGRGAGAGVTAMGVFSDLLRLLDRL